MLLKRLKDVSYLLHVQKSLILIDYLLKNGNTQCVTCVCVCMTL
jgi:hypothetical protein